VKKMVLAVIPQSEAESVLRALVAGGHTATYTGSRGGMLRQAQQMLFIAIDGEDLETVLSIVRKNCRTQVQVDAPERAKKRFNDSSPPVTARLGGAVIFVWDLERFEIY